MVPPQYTEEEIIARLLNMTIPNSEGSSPLQRVVDSGDIQALSKLLNSACSVLNRGSDDAGQRYGFSGRFPPVFSQILE